MNFSCGKINAAYRYSITPRLLAWKIVVSVDAAAVDEIDAFVMQILMLRQVLSVFPFSVSVSYFHFQFQSATLEQIYTVIVSRFIDQLC